MIPFKHRQKTKILKSLEHGETLNYKEIHEKTQVKIDSVRGRLSELRKKELVDKINQRYKITDKGIKYLALGESKIEVY